MRTMRTMQFSNPILALHTQVLVILLVVLVLYWLIKFREGFALFSHAKMKIFNLHPLLTILGFIIFSGEAIIAYKAIPAAKKAVKRVHLSLHLIALAAGIFGVYVAFKVHVELQIPHMYTFHSWFGLTTICLFALQLMLGFVTFMLRGRVESAATRARNAKWHVSAGLYIFWCAIGTSLTGLTEKFVSLDLVPGQEATVVNIIELHLVLFGTSVTVNLFLL